MCDVDCYVHTYYSYDIEKRHLVLIRLVYTVEKKHVAGLFVYLDIWLIGKKDV